MKRLYRYALPALSAALLAGCTDLDTAPFGSTVTSDQKEDVLAKDPSKISASITAITANFTQYAATFGESGNVHSDIGYPSIMLATDTRGTDMVSDYTGYNWFSSSLIFADSQPTDDQILMDWNTLYNQIYTCNNVIGMVDPATEDPTSQYYLAQALAIRAFDYFTLVQMHQFTYVDAPDALGVPIITPENAEEAANGGCVRSTVGEVYEFILGDLEQAISLLEKSNVSRTDKRYVSLDVAYGIRARVNLVMQNYGDALSDAQAALDNTQSSPYTREQVSVPAFIDINDNSWMWGIYVTDQDRVSTTGICNFPSHMGSLNYGYASVGAWRRISKKLFAEIPATDVRKGWFLDENGESPNLSAVFQEYITGAGAPVYTQVKYAPNGNEAGTSNNDNDIPLMRVEEMYFIIAEAQAMGGNPSEGAQTLQGFVNTYRDPSYVCMAVSPEEVREAIWQQRRIEFWGEGISYFDLLRLGKGVDRRGHGFGTDCVFNIAGNDQLMIFPIPYDEVQYNPQCEQNPLASTPTPIMDTEE